MIAALSDADLALLHHLLAGQPVSAATFVEGPAGQPEPFARSVARLEQHGCSIDSLPEGLFVLRASGLETWADYLERYLSGQPRRSIEVYRQTGSTQDIAKRAAPRPVAALADEQTAGRGRLGRSWLAPRGTAVLMSMNFPLDGPDNPQAGPSTDRLALVTAVALAHAIEKLTALPLVRIKWPNDLFVHDKKIAGILIETIAPPRTAIVGIGINVGLTDAHLAGLPAELRPRITSLAMCGRSRDRLLVAREAIDAIDGLVANSDLGVVVDEWRCRNVLSDDVVRFQTNGQQIAGRVLDLDPDEGLIVRSTDGELMHLPAATTSVL